MSDVRDHLCAMLEELGDADAKPDANVVQRAKATALVAGTYIAAVKVEIDARSQLQADNLPPALEQGPQLRAIEGRRA